MLLVQINVTMLLTMAFVGVVGGGMPIDTKRRDVTVKVAWSLAVAWMVMSWVMILWAIWGGKW